MRLRGGSPGGSLMLHGGRFLGFGHWPPRACRGGGGRSWDPQPLTHAGRRRVVPQGGMLVLLGLGCTLVCYVLLLFVWSMILRVPHVIPFCGCCAHAVCITYSLGICVLYCYLAASATTVGFVRMFNTKWDVRSCRYNTHGSHVITGARKPTLCAQKTRKRIDLADSHCPGAFTIQSSC